MDPSSARVALSEFLPDVGVNIGIEVPLFVALVLKSKILGSVPQDKASIKLNFAPISEEISGKAPTQTRDLPEDWLRRASACERSILSMQKKHRFLRCSYERDREALEVSGLRRSRSNFPLTSAPLTPKARSDSTRNVIPRWEVIGLSWWPS